MQVLSKLLGGIHMQGILFFVRVGGTVPAGDPPAPEALEWICLTQ